MWLKSGLRKALCRNVRPYGYELIPRDLLFDWQKNWECADPPSHGDVALPPEAEAFLTTSNPRIKELERLYARVDPSVRRPAVWKADYVSAEDLKHFRGDNAYIWQVRHSSRVNYVVSALYVKAVDTLGLFERMTEDGAFGASTLTVGGKLVSRDLLDSVLEINFLHRHLDLSGRCVRILDIGSGYGRLAHRVAETFPDCRYFCTDAVPVSTFLCEYYLKYRGVDDRATVVPLSELDSLQNTTFDVAVNVHSFSECTLVAIDWWIRWLRERNVRTIMIVPNVRGPMTNAREDFGSILERHGYRRTVEEPKYLDPAVSAFAAYPAWYYLYELQKVD